MREAFRAVIWLSVFSGVILLLCPEGGVKRVLSVLCTSALALSILPAVNTLGVEWETEAMEQNWASQQIEAQAKLVDPNCWQNLLHTIRKFRTYLSDQGR